MIDNQDKQTLPLPLDEQPAKRGRGRPGTGQALSNAERQRLYRERKKQSISLELNDEEAVELIIWLEVISDQYEGSVGAERAKALMDRIRGIHKSKMPKQAVRKASSRKSKSAPS